MIQLRSVHKIAKPDQDGFPFSVPTIRAFSELTFSSEVTFLVGENGSGKSTFLEAIACAARSITVGSEDAEGDRTLASIRALASTFKLTWTNKRRAGFFLRSEDFFGFVKRLTQMRECLQKDLEAVEEDYKGRSDYARGLARGPYMRELAEMQRYYGQDLDARSHGEAYFTLFKSRFVPNGLYLLDEPESALSPMRQIVLMSLIKMMVAENAQFIIATHSPILMAYPGATILSFDGGTINPVQYDTLDHVVVTRTFLNNPAQFLKSL